jgi:hypothetical protein
VSGDRARRFNVFKKISALACSNKDANSGAAYRLRRRNQTVDRRLNDMDAGALFSRSRLGARSTGCDEFSFRAYNRFAGAVTWTDRIRICMRSALYVQDKRNSAGRRTDHYCRRLMPMQFHENHRPCGKSQGDAQGNLTGWDLRLRCHNLAGVYHEARATARSGYSSAQKNAPGDACHPERTSGRGSQLHRCHFFPRTEPLNASPFVLPLTRLSP